MANVLGFTEWIGARLFWRENYVARPFGLSGSNRVSAVVVGD